ncbi:glycosyltransferase [Pseudoalteromonas sp. B193]
MSIGFISHRLPIAVEALNNGYDVTIACNFTKHKQELIDMGFTVVEIPFSRSGGSIVSEVKTLKAIRALIQSQRPDLIHAVTIKPVLYTGLVLKTIGKNPICCRNIWVRVCIYSEFLKSKSNQIYSFFCL